MIRHTFIIYALLLLSLSLLFFIYALLYLFILFIRAITYYHYIIYVVTAPPLLLLLLLLHYTCLFIGATHIFIYYCHLIRRCHYLPEFIHDAHCYYTPSISHLPLLVIFFIAISRLGWSSAMLLLLRFDHSLNRPAIYSFTHTPVCIRYEATLLAYHASAITPRLVWAAHYHHYG